VEQRGEADAVKVAISFVLIAVASFAMAFDIQRMGGVMGGGTIYRAVDESRIEAKIKTVYPKGFTSDEWNFFNGNTSYNLIFIEGADTRNKAVGEIWYGWVTNAGTIKGPDGQPYRRYLNRKP
jgi:hypothetical protein